MLIEANDFFGAAGVPIRQLAASAANRPEFVFQPRCGTPPRFPLKLFAQSLSNRVRYGPAGHLRQLPGQGVGLRILDVERHRDSL